MFNCLVFIIIGLFILEREGSYQNSNVSFTKKRLLSTLTAQKQVVETKADVNTASVLDESNMKIICK